MIDYFRKLLAEYKEDIKVFRDCHSDECYPGKLLARKYQMKRIIQQLKELSTLE